MTDRHSQAPDRIPLLEQFIKGYLSQAKAGSSPPMNSLLPRAGFVELQLQHSPILDSSLGIQKTLPRSTLVSQEGLKFNPLMPIALNNQNLAARLWNIGMKTCLFSSAWSRPLNASSWDKPGPGTSLAGPEQPRGIKEALGWEEGQAAWTGQFHSSTFVPGSATCLLSHFGLTLPPLLASVPLLRKWR